MNPDLAAVLILLTGAVVLFAMGKPRMDAVALLMMAAMPFTGVLTLQEVITGFSDPSVVLIAALFVLGEGLVRTGVTQRLGDWLASRSARNETRLIVLLMLVVAGIGSVMSSTAVVAIFIPAVLRIARNTSTPAGRLMMPLSFAALFSGMMSLIATPPNLVVNSELVRNGYQGFHLFSITPFGLPLLAVGIAYILFARRWLVRPSAVDESRAERPRLSQWIEEYKLDGREHRLRVGPGSALIGRTLRELELRGSAGVNVVAVERSGRFGNHFVRADATTELQADDVLLLDLLPPVARIEDLRARFDLEELPLSGTYFSTQPNEIGMAEVMIPSTSQLIGKSVVEAKIRTQYGLTVVGMRRANVALDATLLHTKLQLGDTLLLIGRWRQIKRLQSGGKDVILLHLPAEIDDVVPAPTRAPQALFSLAIVIALMVTNAVPNVLAALIGILMLGAFRCIDADSAYRSIHWQSIVLIVGMLPFSLALQKTGGITLAADALLNLTGEASPRVVLAALFFATAGLGLFISNTATALLMAPVAMAVGEAMQASPYPFAMIVSLAASCAFMTPVSSPVNTLVVGPGGYRFADFVKVGVPFTVIAMVLSVLLVPWLLPF